MNLLLQTGLANVAVATLLAAVAFAVGRVSRRPALAHCLWVLVLVKLLTPPLFPRLELPWLAAPETPTAAPVPPPPSTFAFVPAADAAPAGEGELTVVRSLLTELPPEAPGAVAVPAMLLELDRAPAALPTAPPAAARVRAPDPVPAAVATPATAWWWNADVWLWALVAVWACGSLAWFVRAAFHMVRFHRLLACASPADGDLQELAERLARQMGLARCPQVLLLPGPLPPLVWAGLGPARVFFPAMLLGRLDAEGQAALLAHELAHVRRRDHWVRWLELVALGLYWWCPLAWWARRQIHVHEEECCDAWVVAELPPRAYAAAILETVDFLSDARPRLPVMASGLDRVGSLKRRLTMIMQRTTPRGVSSLGWIAVAALGLVLLPLLPTLAQQSPKKDDGRPAEPAPAPTEPVRRPAADEEPITFDARPVNLHGETSDVWSIAFTPDGRTLVAGGGSANGPGDVKVWDLATGRELRSFRETLGVASVAVSPGNQMIAFASWNGKTRVHETASGKDLFTFANDGVARVAFSPDRKFLATATESKTVKLWDLATGKEKASLQGDLFPFHCVAFSPDGTRLAAGGGDGRESGTNQVNVWDVADGKQVLTLKGHTSTVLSVAFSPDGQLLATGGVDMTVKVWAAATGKIVNTLTGYQGPVEGLAFAPDGKTLVGSSHDRTVRWWNVANGRPLPGPREQGDRVRALAFSPTGGQLAMGGGEKVVRVWDTRMRADSLVLQRVADAPLTTDPIRALAYSPDGKVLAATGEDGTVRLRDAATGRALQTLKGHEDAVTAVVYSPDGMLVATTSKDKTVRLWDPATGQQLRSLTGHGNWVFAAAFSPDGKTLATAGYDRLVRLWDVATGKERAALAGHTAGVRAVAFSPDGKLLASGSVDRTVRLWDAGTGKEQAALRGHGGTVLGVAFAPDGKTLASGGEDNTVKLWDVAAGKERAALRGHADAVAAVAFSPGGATLTSGSLDGTVRVWDPATGTERATLRGHADAVTAVAYSPDGWRLVSGSLDRTLKVWSGVQAPSARARAERLREMEGRAKGLKVLALVKNEAVPLEMVRGPALSYQEPGRADGEDTLWLWGTRGRPAAAVTVMQVPGPNGRAVWVYEMVALTKYLARVEGPEGWKWAPQRLADDQRRLREEAPAGTEAERLAQMEKIIRRFTGSEMRGTPPQPVDLQLLQPRPLHRYADPDNGLVDGAVYALGLGPNPEALLLIEARSVGGDRTAWYYSVARLTAAEVAVRLDDREVWKVPAITGEFAPEESYFVITPGRGPMRSAVPPPPPVRPGFGREMPAPPREKAETLWEGTVEGAPMRIVKVVDPATGEERMQIEGASGKGVSVMRVPDGQLKGKIAVIMDP